MHVKNFKYLITGLSLFIFLSKAEEVPCRISGIAGTVDSSVCLIKDFINSLEKLTPEKKREIAEKKYDFMSHNFLFFGSPGRGKTTTCKRLAKEFHGTAKFYHSQELIDSKSIVSEIYQEAEKELQSTGRPVVIFVDNIELFAKLGGRDNSDPGNRRKLDIDSKANHIVTDIDFAIAKYEYNPYIITILISDVDYSQIFSSLLNRIDGVTGWRLPNHVDRKEIITHYAQQHGRVLPNWLVSLMAYESAGATGKDIEDTFNMGNSNLFQCYSLFKKGHKVSKGLKLIVGLATMYVGLRYGIKYYKK